VTLFGSKLLDSSRSEMIKLKEANDKILFIIDKRHKSCGAVRGVFVNEEKQICAQSLFNTQTEFVTCTSDTRVIEKFKNSQGGLQFKKLKKKNT
jgi:hypothetical protein